MENVNFYCPEQKSSAADGRGMDMKGKKGRGVMNSCLRPASCDLIITLQPVNKNRNNEHISELIFSYLYCSPKDGHVFGI